MIKDNEASRPGLYDVYHDTEGKNIIVLQGLSIENPQTEPPLQQFIHTHYRVFEVGYWGLLFVVSLVVITKCIAVPLYNKFK
ncbi:hypothetical protein A3C87_01255 [Candidatus Kaiserbacteria bacterium RIFCSPHIGHO2_02_FULL_49_34]|uniref:Uncharacterized protein n=1 Tax=Candidatus Kaiserbacteria bacterium RIFCSPHIGHO2_02_FULL_49_34 TaxID=1798491 RepID=A0A1F6DLN6_9BACT|nr:MAG: hypothetical protein A3C87_01255 [Candidatus Kaiserbacteria bacterium RIFCSPHIGHO2_02_FULL_49_34]